MKYTRKGTGEFLVLVHGALADERMWFPHIEYLSQNYDVVSISLRHFDGTNEGGFGLNTHADDLAGFLTRLSEEKNVNVAAWSYGADVVLNMLVKHNIFIVNLFLYEPGYPGCLSGNDLNKWKKDAKKMFAPVFEKFIEGNLQAAVESLIDGSGNREGFFKNQSEEIRMQQLEKAHTLNLQLNQKEIAEINEKSIAEIGNPIVVGYGSETRDLFRLVSEKVADAAEHAILKIIDGEGHMLPIEKPEKFSVIIKQNIFGSKIS